MKKDSFAPKVSVIIATGNCADNNHAAHMEECLDSVLGQSLREIEVIVADIGSDDRTRGMREMRGILERYAESDERVRLIRMLSDAHGSRGHAKNLALDKAYATFFIIVEPCDCLKENALEVLHGQLQEKPELDLVKGFIEGFGEGVNTSIIRPDGGAGHGEGKSSAMARWMMFGCAGMYRRSLVERMNIRHYDKPGYGNQNIMMDFLGFAYSESLLVSDAVYRRRLGIEGQEGQPVTDPKAVYDICAEYRALEERLRGARKGFELKGAELELARKSELKSGRRGSQDKWIQYRYAFWQSYFQSNLEMYERLANELKPKLSARMYDDIRAAMRRGDFDREHFDASARELLELLLDSPKEFGEEMGRQQWEREIDRARILVKLDREEAAKKEAARRWEQAREISRAGQG